MQIVSKGYNYDIVLHPFNVASIFNQKYNNLINIEVI